MQELIESAAFVVGEGLTIDKAALAIKRQRGLERRPTAGLQAQPPQAACASLLDDALQ